MYMTKQKQTHRYRKQPNGYQWEEGRREGQYKDGKVGITHYWLKDVLYKTGNRVQTLY